MSAFDPIAMECTADAIYRPIRWMLRLPGWFTEHPMEKGMTYAQHCYRAWDMAWRLGYGSLCLFVHGVFPFSYQTLGTRTVKELYMEIRREEEREKEEGGEKQV